MSKNRQDVKELTANQEEYMRYIASGMSNRAIAQVKGIALGSADQTVERIKSKLGLLSKEEVKQYAIEHGYGGQE